MNWTTQALKLLALVLTGYTAICLLVFVRQRQMLFHPEKADEGEMRMEASTNGLIRWFDNSGRAIGWVTPDGRRDVGPTSHRASRRWKAHLVSFEARMSKFGLAPFHPGSE